MDYDLDKDISDDDLFEMLIEDNYQDLEYVREMLSSVKTEGRILALASLGLWNGRVTAYKWYKHNLEAILYSDCDYCEWNFEKDLEGVLSHHDGTNYLTYREVRPELTDRQLGNLYALLDENVYNNIPLTKAQINRYTRSLVPVVKGAFR